MYDEYGIQDLLEVLLKLLFNDVKREERTLQLLGFQVESIFCLRKNK